MGAQWKHAGRLANASKRGAVIGKLVKEIMVSAKVGDPHPENNARLRTALEEARKHSVPRDTIDRAIKRGSGQTDDPINFETVIYEGFAPSKVPVIVECLTDNKNRTAADVRMLFKKGHLGAIGSVTWMFDHVGIVDASHPDGSQDLETVAIEAGAQNVERTQSDEIPEGHIGARFFCDRPTLDAVAKYLSNAKWAITTSEMSYIAKTLVDLPSEQRKEVADFLNALDEHDDVHRLYTALK